jgi:UPF0716 protein FxsA
MVLLVLLLVYPMLEIAGFILVGDWLGLGNTLLLVMISMLFGLLVLRRNGLGALRRVRGRPVDGKPPMREAFDGLCLAVSGLLLIIPGFASDVLALLLFLGPLRSALYRRFATAAAQGAAFSGVGSGGWRASGRPPQPRPRGNSPIIEADYVVMPGSERAGIEGPAADQGGTDPGPDSTDSERNRP